MRAIARSNSVNISLINSWKQKLQRMKVGIIMDIDSLYLSHQGWLPMYKIDTAYSYFASDTHPAYFPFRGIERYTNMPRLTIQILMKDEDKNLLRDPKMIPRVMIKP